MFLFKRDAACIGRVSYKILVCKSFSHFFNKKYWHFWDINVWNFKETLTNDVVSFEQPGPVHQSKTLIFAASLIQMRNEGKSAARNHRLVWNSIGTKGRKSICKLISTIILYRNSLINSPKRDNFNTKARTKFEWKTMVDTWSYRSETKCGNPSVQKLRMNLRLAFP